MCEASGRAGQVQLPKAGQTIIPWKHQSMPKRELETAQAKDVPVVATRVKNERGCNSRRRAGCDCRSHRVGSKQVLLRR
jgi:hypothetical protein